MAKPFNAASYLVDRQVERGYGDHVAVAGPGGPLTYAELAEQVAAASAGWRSIGLRPEERVMLYAADHPYLLVALLSVMRCGGVPVPVSTLYSGAELNQLLQDSRARALVVDAERMVQAKEALDSGAPDLHTMITLDCPATAPSSSIGTLSWQNVMVRGWCADAEPPDRTSEDSTALWLYTSGTTGTPKAAMHRHGSIQFAAESYGQAVLGIDAEDRCFSASKISFAYGLGNSCFLPLAAGATTILDPARPTAQNVFRRLIDDRPTVFFAVPSVYAALLREEDGPPDAFDSVRFAVSAGERLPAELQRRFDARFGVELVNGLGMTETLHIFVSNYPGESQPDSIGTVVPGYDVRVLAEDGSPAESGQAGALQVRAPSSAIGYWARSAATRKVFEGEWINTGDLVRRDASGRVTCLGRTTDMIKSGGLWVSPAEVEARLVTHPAVAEAAVVGILDADGLEKPVACVVPSPGAKIDPTELIAFCRTDLPSFKRPREVFVFDALPTTPTGKLQRHALRVAVAERLNPISRILS